MENQLSRKKLLNGECTHRQYYGQFITIGYVKMIGSVFGYETLKTALEENENLSTIKLERWDSITVPLGTGQLMKEQGDYLTLSAIVCIAKEGARQFLELKKETTKTKKND